MVLAQHVHLVRAARLRVDVAVQEVGDVVRAPGDVRALPVEHRDFVAAARVSEEHVVQPVVAVADGHRTVRERRQQLGDTRPKRRHDVADLAVDAVGEEVERLLPRLRVRLLHGTVHQVDARRQPGDLRQPRMLPPARVMERQMRQRDARLLRRAAPHLVARAAGRPEVLEQQDVLDLLGIAVAVVAARRAEGNLGRHLAVEAVLALVQPIDPGQLPRAGIERRHLRDERRRRASDGAVVRQRHPRDLADEPRALPEHLARGRRHHRIAGNDATRAQRIG